MVLKPDERSEWIVDEIQAAHRGETGAAPAGAERAALEHEAAALGALWQALDAVESKAGVEPPTAAMTERFARHLASIEAHRPSPRRVRPPIPRLRLVAGFAAAAAVIAIAVVAAWRSRTPLHVPVPAGSGAAPTVFGRLESVGSGALECGPLLATVRDDPSPGVRIAAIETLSERCGESALPGGLAPLLAGESDPLARLLLIRTIGEQRRLEDEPALRRLMRDPQLDPILRREIERSLAELAS